ncbi:MAG: class I SAM-dependent methyltransferase [Sulfuritalea sp.]|nr:class I SAM-dependent methyltransferase [Sulfuritalea sp.]
MKHTESQRRQASNVQARQTWEYKAVGSQRASSPAGSREYFEQIRAYRYGYETPFIPDFFGFASLAGKRVLEIGVGNGIDAVEMLRGGAIYTGIDITQNHLNLTRRYVDIVSGANLPGRVEAILEGDLLECALAGNYDVVYSFGVLHHIAHEAEFLRRIHGLLRPGGELRVALYSRYSFFNAWLLATWVVRNRMRNPLSDWQSHVAEGSSLGNPVVIKIRSQAQIQALLQDNGFEVVRYAKKGFVQRYLPLLGRFLHPAGRVLDGCASLLGWYHCFICRRR